MKFLVLWLLLGALGPIVGNLRHIFRSPAHRREIDDMTSKAVAQIGRVRWCVVLASLSLLGPISLAISLASFVAPNRKE